MEKTAILNNRKSRQRRPERQHGLPERAKVRPRSRGAWKANALAGCVSLPPKCRRTWEQGRETPGSGLRQACGYPLARVVFALCLWIVAPHPAWSDINLPELDALPAAEKYRQLNLMIMVSAGADEAFIDQFAPGSESNGNEQAMPLFDIEDFQTPLNRIVDQRAMLSRVARVFRFTLARQPDIEHELFEIATSDPAQVAEVNLIELAEDAIIIRSALAGTIEFLAGDDNSALPAGIEPYRARTIYLRNVMEYWKFDEELVAITENALKDTGGRMAAYQRMLEEEPNLVGFKQHLEAVEAIYKNIQPLKVKQKQLESKDLIEAESEVH